MADISHNPNKPLQHALDFAHALRLVKQKRARVERKKRGAFIYIVQAGEFVKIGIAVDVKVRLSELQVGCPYQMSLLRFWRSLKPARDERMIHHKLKPYRVRGEWFKLPELVLAAIMSEF